MENAISIKRLTVSYSGVEAVNDITFDIKKGDFICIIGPNGGGKTTLLNTILGFLKPDNGEIKIFGKDIKKSNSALSYVPQTAAVDRNFPISAIETVMTAFLKSGLHPFKRFSKNEKQKALELLRTVKLENYANRQISELSGGEFQRLLIARALALDPQILLLDEPTANIDPNSRNNIFSLLNSLNADGMTVVAVTHDLNAAVTRASKVACINRRLIYYGKPKNSIKLSAMLYGDTLASALENEGNENV